VGTDDAKLAVMNPRASDPNASLAARDLAHVWHPCTQMHDHESLPPIPIRRAAGVWLEDHGGKRYLDAISSWWVNLFGHANPAINAAVAAQAHELEHVMLAGFTHEPAVRLAERLCQLAPPGLNRCFFADNGSSAIEVALKMSYHFWRNCGHERKRRFATLANSYHGETLGALSVGDVDLFRETYKPLLLDVVVVPSPTTLPRVPGMSPVGHARASFRAMEEALERHTHELAAVIVEPLVQCAGGMRMYDPVYLRLLREACDRHQVHLIADEIAVGFGRTGTLFACEQADITPDFMCLSKGLTGGYLPLSVVLTGDGVYSAFYAEFLAQRAFLHSHSYTGNPLACAAANATLDIFERESVIERNRALAAHLGRSATRLADHPHVAEIRQTGMILAIDVVRDRANHTPYPWQERRGRRMHRHALEQGVLLRPLGETIYFMPPYVITPGEIDHMIDVAAAAIDTAVRD
jgi:adenosylmethionine-8-amino-7-oxononanoate aminotransferase